jgi:hypothetical protein
MDGSNLGALIIVLAFFGLIAGSIAYSKNRTTGTFIAYTFLGVLLPILGIIMALLVKAPAPPPMPPGWYADPWAQAALRYYDGRAWTWHTQPAAPAA